MLQLIFRFCLGKARGVHKFKLVHGIFRICALCNTFWKEKYICPYFSYLWAMPSYGKKQNSYFAPLQILAKMCFSFFRSRSSSKPPYERKTSNVSQCWSPFPTLFSKTDIRDVGLLSSFLPYEIIFWYHNAQYDHKKNMRKIVNPSYSILDHECMKVFWTW